jgi:dTDP-4-amino-4,6-dideoxygalactose transaminase
MMKIPFSPPYIDEDVIQEVTDCLKSGWITSGPRVKALEEEVMKYTGAEAAMCVNSWTSGAALILKWWGIGVGDEVIVPAYTYSATALTVHHAGAKPVMVDTGIDFNATVANIKKAITPRTKAIMPVDIAGWPCDYDAMMELVNDEEVKEMFIAGNELQAKLGRILVISDAAHSIGAMYKGRRTGTQVDITIFSFHAVKNVTTSEGGAICFCLPKPFDNTEVYRYLKVFGLNGQTKDAFSKSQAGGGGWRYDIVNAGIKVNMPDVCAAIGLIQLRKYNDLLLLERRRVFDTYARLFSEKPWAQLPPGQDDFRTSSFHLYALRIIGITEEQRDKMIEYVSEKGVSVNVHFIPMPMLTFFKGQGYMIADYPVAYDNFSREISLPIYPQLTEEQLNYIAAVVEEAYASIQ